MLEEHRPVPLWQHIMVGDRLHDLFIDDERRVVTQSQLATSGTRVEELRRIIGDLNDKQRLLLSLDLQSAPTAEAPGP